MGVERVARAAARSAETGVAADRVVAPLRIQTVVVVQQAFVNILLGVAVRKGELVS